MRLRNPAESRTSRGAITWTAVMVAALCMLSATNASAALSGSFNGNLSASPNTNISPVGAVGPFTVVGGPGFCVGPPNTCSSGSGLSGSASVSGTQVTYQFFGSTAGAGPGSFTVTLSGFSTTITGFTLVSGSLSGGTLSSSFTSNSLTFTETTGTDFDATNPGGATIVFNVTSGTAAVPEPSSVVLLGTLLFGAVFMGRRRLLVRGSRA